MIKSIKLKFGRSLNAPADALNGEPITIFVGPNNSGKSKVLTEIQSILSGSHSNPSIISEIEFSPLSGHDAENILEQIKLPKHQGVDPSDDVLYFGSIGTQHSVRKDQLLSFLENPKLDVRSYCVYFLSSKTLLLDGRSRIQLTGQQQASDLNSLPSNALQVLFKSDEKRREVSRVCHEAFQYYFLIDPTQLGFFKIRLSLNAPTSLNIERELTDKALDFFQSAKTIDQFSDGVKAFLGIILNMVAGEPFITLIDEPEAFLSPPLAMKLGREVSLNAKKKNKQVYVSTHSASFLMGCIQSGMPMNIVRLTYRNEYATARNLQSGELLELMRNPLLRSMGVLNGLFHEFVVVTESDADRAFYQEINERLLNHQPDRAMQSCLFINAQNKQTIHSILRPLRKLGIPAIGIVDIDILKEGGAPWINTLQSANIPTLTIDSLSILRKRVYQAMKDTGKDMKREGGVYILDGDDRQAALDLLGQLAQYGIFTVLGGELECWLKSLGATGHGPTWLVNVFEKMGEDAAREGYIHPGDDDVWQFISQIREWAVNPNRKGIPD